jgi:hypothetical protein
MKKRSSISARIKFPPIWVSIAPPASTTICSPLPKRKNKSALSQKNRTLKDLWKNFRRLHREWTLLGKIWCKVKRKS